MIVVRSAPLLLLLSLAIGTIPASAVDVPGGGPAKSDCYVGFEVDATPAPTVSGAKVTGKACGSACAFKVKACINETAVVSGCTAPNVTRVTIVPPAVGLQPPPTPGSTQACGPEATVSVPLKGKAHNRPGKKKLKMVATADAKPKKDVDVLKLLCMPNPGDAGCGGGTPVPGNRVFSPAAGDIPVGSHFFTSALPGDVAKPGTSFGAITLAAGTPGPDGVATLAIASDSIIGFQALDGSFVCAKIEAASSHGKIDCDGGTPVGVTVTGDSHGTGANDPPVIMLEQGPPGRPGDGYFAGTARIANCPGDPSGACVGTLATSADCANPGKVNFAVVQPMMGATTTGTATAQVINPNSIIGDGGPLTVTGMPFDCNNWDENGPGIIETPQVAYDTSLAGDIATVLQADD